MELIDVLMLVCVCIACITCVVLLWRSSHRKLYGYLHVYQSKEEGVYMLLELLTDTEDLNSGERVTFVVDKSFVDSVNESGRR